MNDVNYLAAAYLIGLVLLFTYLFFLDRHQKQLSRDIAHLEGVVNRCIPAASREEGKLPSMLLLQSKRVNHSASASSGENENTGEQK